MVIRCERCSTLYELDESLLAPTGSQVQCTKCENVFTAYPPRAPGRTLVGVPAAPAAEPAAAPVGPPPNPPSPRAAGGVGRGDAAEPPRPAPAAAPPASPAPPAAAGDAARAEAPRRRSGQAPVYRPPAPVAAAPSAVRSPVLRRDTVGAFEARLRATARWRWLAPILIAAGVAAIVAGVLALGRRGDAGAERVRAEALSLLERDDVESLDAAAAQLDAAMKGAPKRRAAAADRVLTDVLRATSLMEEAEAAGARAGTRAEARDRLRREQPGGWEEAARQAGEEAAALEGEARGKAERARLLVSTAREALRALQTEVGETPEVARALGVFQASGGDRERERVHRLVRAAREKGARDPWLDLADGWADSRELDRAARERAVARLGALAAARPELLRGRYLLARTQAALGRRGEAVAVLDGILSANPKHEAARRLREELAAPAAVPPPAPPAPVAEAPPATPPPRRRKVVPQPVPAASTPPPIETPAPAPSPEAAAAPGAGPASAPEPPPPAVPPAQEPPRVVPEPAPRTWPVRPESEQPGVGGSG